MLTEPHSSATPPFSALERFISGSRSVVRPQIPRCELCSEPIFADHGHLLDLGSREVRCTCRACTTLFDRDEAGGRLLARIRDRLWSLPDFKFEEHVWAGFGIPVDMAFFYRDSQQERVRGFYPSPMGLTESQLTLEAWSELESQNPVLHDMADDVEALLVDRTYDRRRYWIAPIDECYALVGVMRTHWKGLAGGDQAWAEIELFLQRLNEKARVVESSNGKE